MCWAILVCCAHCARADFLWQSPCVRWIITAHGSPRVSGTTTTGCVTCVPVCWRRRTHMCMCAIEKKKWGGRGQGHETLGVGRMMSNTVASVGVVVCPAHSRACDSPMPHERSIIFSLTGLHFLCVAVSFCLAPHPSGVVAIVFAGSWCSD